MINKNFTFLLNNIIKGTREDIFLKTELIQLDKMCRMTISIYRIVCDGRATQWTRSFSVEPR